MWISALRWDASGLTCRALFLFIWPDPVLTEPVELPCALSPGILMHPHRTPFLPSPVSSVKQRQKVGRDQHVSPAPKLQCYLSPHCKQPPRARAEQAVLNAQLASL